MSPEILSMITLVTGLWSD